MKNGFRRLYIEDDIVQSKNFTAFYRHLQSINDDTIHISNDATIYINGPHYSNLKYECIKDLRIVSDITFFKKVFLRKL